MNLLRLKLDSLHCALLVAIVLLAVYTFGSFREGVYHPIFRYLSCSSDDQCTAYLGSGWACMKPTDTAGLHCLRTCTDKSICNPDNVYGYGGFGADGQFKCKIAPNSGGKKYCAGRFPPHTSHTGPSENNLGAPSGTE